MTDTLRPRPSSTLLHPERAHGHGRGTPDPLWDGLRILLERAYLDGAADASAPLDAAAMGASIDERRRASLALYDELTWHRERLQRETER